jgi:hypothetical protein
MRSGLVMAFLTTALISSTLLRRRTEEAISAREALEAAFRAEQAEKALHQARFLMFTPTIASELEPRDPADTASQVM